MSDLPKEVSRGTVRFGNLAIEVIQLDNGQRLISAESMADFMAFLNGDGFEMKDVTPGSTITLTTDVEGDRP